MIEFFQRLYHFEELIRWGGLPVIAVIVFAETGLMVGFFLPGDSLLVTAGLLAASGYLSVTALLVCLCLSAIMGDSLSYAIGRRMGPKIFTREHSIFFHKDHLLRAKHFYEKYGSKTIVIARFIPIVRTFAPVVAGVGEMEYSKFIFYNIAGGVGWVCSMILGGYFLGRSIPHIDKHIHKVILVVIFVSLLPMAYEWWKSRKVEPRIHAD